MSTLPLDQHVSVTEAAELLRRSDRTVRWYIKTGQLRAVKHSDAHGFCWRIPRAALDAFVPRIWGGQLPSAAPIPAGHAHAVHFTDHGDEHCRCGASRFVSALSGRRGPWHRVQGFPPIPAHATRR